jgi:prevent-host-death family protein
MRRAADAAGVTLTDRPPELDAIAAAAYLARLARWVPQMAEIVNMHEAKTSLSRLVERALAGEEVVIARNGEPLVKLVPIPKERKPRVPGRYKGKIWIAPDCFAPMSEEELDEWYKWEC